MLLMHRHFLNSIQDAYMTIGLLFSHSEIKCLQHVDHPEPNEDRCHAMFHAT